jgi:hypothetical protein
LRVRDEIEREAKRAIEREIGRVRDETERERESWRPGERSSGDRRR